MSITGAIANANTGLVAASQRANLVSGNIANALTPGYARRELVVNEKILGGAGAGVSVDGVKRISDPVLTRERRVADGILARDQTLAQAAIKLNAAIGEPEDAFSLFAQYHNLESALRSLAETPESLPLQNQLLDAAKSIVSAFNTLSATAQEMRQHADRQIAREVDVVNAALKQIERLNADIASGSVSGRDVSALEDERQRLIDQVAQIIPVREIARDGGRVDLITTEGVFLIAGTAKTVEFAQTGFITPDRAYDGGAGVLSGLSVGGVDITPGGGAMSVRQGTMAGHFAVRDEIAPAFQAQMDSLARDLIERFSGLDPTLDPAEAGLFTDAGAAFDPDAEVGLSARITINPAVDPQQGGAVWRLRDGLGANEAGPGANAAFIRDMLDALTASRPLSAGAGVSGAHSAAESAAAISSSVGVALVTAQSYVAASQARSHALIEAELSVSGVDTDREMQQLLLIERAYAANARVIQVAERMLMTLLEMKR